MIASKIEIHNFRSIGPDGIVIPLNGVTALVGQNSSGKSNVLLALDIFRNFKKSKITDDSYFNRDVTKPIEIKVTFSELSTNEQCVFRRHLSPDSTLTISQSISIASARPPEEIPEEQDAEGKVSERKTAKTVLTGIEWLDDPPTKVTDIKALWKQSTLQVGDVDFKAWSALAVDQPPSKDDLKAKIEDFWNSNHWAALPKTVADTDTLPLGWANRLAGHLPTVVYIQAIRRFSEEAKDTKSSPFGALLSWFVESVTSDIRNDIQTKLDAVYETALASLPRELDSGSGELLTRLELINRILNKYVPAEFASKLEVAYQRPEVNQTIFGETGVHADDGYKSLIENKGHGLQRSAILAVVRAYLELRSKLAVTIPALGRVIFAVEEPELFLHPTVKRATYRLFRVLAKNGDQVIYSTHDGAFLNVEHFDEIRVCRKKTLATPPHTYVEHLSEERLLAIWKQLTGKSSIVVESIRAHLQNAYDPLCNEGFLARKVLLVEGASETGALPIYLKAIGFDPDDQGCAIIAAGSVELLDTFAVLFSELGIPVFVFWDGDHPGVARIGDVEVAKRDDVRNKSKRNANLLRLAGMTADTSADFVFPSKDLVSERGAILKTDFEDTFHHTLPDSEAVRGEATKLYGSSSKPMCARFFASTVVRRGDAESDPGKFVPEIVKQVAARVRALDSPLRIILT